MEYQKDTAWMEPSNLIAIVERVLSQNDAAYNDWNIEDIIRKGKNL